MIKATTTTTTTTACVPLRTLLFAPLDRQADSPASRLIGERMIMQLLGVTPENLLLIFCFDTHPNRQLDRETDRNTS